MSHFARYLTQVADMPLAPFFFDAALKATVLLALATVATVLLRCSSAAVRHRIWCLTFAALLLLPGLSALLPEWRLAVLPGGSSIDHRSPLAPRGEPSVARRRSYVAQAELTSEEHTSAAERSRLPLAEREDYGSPERRNALDDAIPVYDAPIVSEPAPQRRFSAATFWLAGALVTLIPLVIAFLRTLCLRQRARPIEADAWLTLINELCRRLSLARRVALCETEAALMPMTWGVLRPVVLLPSEAHNWPDRLRRIVLLHELAHIKRCDVGFQLLGRVACAVYWFHPLAWYALRRLRIERELACDDCVVLAGERATDYAAELLQIARSYRPVYYAAAVAMAQRGNLEHRLRALFDRARSHLPVSPRAARLLLAGVLLLVAAIATIRLAPRAEAGDGEQPPPVATSADRSEDQTVSDSETAIRGVVLGPDGRPRASANVSVRSEIYDADDPPLETTTTDAEGRFAISLRWPEFDERVGAKPDLLLVAAADGLAPDWKHLGKDEPLADVALKLSEEKPIEGRIVNAEGRPLAGVNLRVQTVLRYDNDTMKLVLDDFANDRQEVMRTSKGWWYGRLANLPVSVTTAADGRFQLRGVAPNTLIILHARGGGIRDTRFRATTATHDTIRAPEPPAVAPYGPRAGAVLFGSEFDYIAEPGRRVQGTVRDGQTRRPVAKAKILFYQPTTLGGRGLDVLTAETDAAGRYVLEGCAKADHLTLSVEPPADEAAYLPCGLKIADRPGLAPIEQDVELVKGIELRGRIVDSQSGQPLVAEVEYEPIYLNKYAATLYERRAHLNSRARSKPDGSFRIAVAPGPGAVAVSFPSTAPHDYTTVRVSHHDLVKLFEASPSHRELALSPELKEGFPDALPTQQDGGYSMLIQTNGARVVLVCPEEQQAPEPLEVKLVRGRSLAGQVLDPAGQPLVGITARLVNPGFAWQTLEGPEFLVTALAAGEKREISFYHATRKLGAFRGVTAADAAPLAIRLEKCVAAVGRVLDEDGAPRAGVHVWFWPAHNPFSLPYLFAVTDADGRFRTDELIPGGHYKLMRASPNGALGHLQLTRDQLVFAVGSGQTRDLGDLVVKGPVQTVSESKATDHPDTRAAADVPQPPSADVAQPPSAVGALGNTQKKPSRESNAAPPRDENDAAPAAKDDAEVTLRGRVLGPDGKPAAGTEIYWVQTKNSGDDSPADVWWEKRAVTDDDGRFQWTLTEPDAKIGASNKPPLIAYKHGFGLDGLNVGREEAKMELTLRLTEECPIRGRLSDTEGRPVKGAKVVVANIESANDGPLDRLLEKWKRTPQQVQGIPERIVYLQKRFAPLTVESDAEGQFTIPGVGKERVARLNITAPGFMSEELRLVAREGFDAADFNKQMTANMVPFMRAQANRPRFAAPVFEHVMEAELVIRGTVFTEPDRKPVAGVGLGAGDGRQNLSTIPTTDAAGHFEVHGVRRGQEVPLSVHPRRGDLLPRNLRLDVAPGQTVVEVEVELKPGIVVEGRIFDQATGLGVHGNVSYVPLAENRFIEQPGYDGAKRMRIFMNTSDDGHFRHLVPPGLGVLMAQVTDSPPRAAGNKPKPYRQAAFNEEESQRVPTTVRDGDRYFTISDNAVVSLNLYGAVKVIDLAADSGPLTCDLALDPGKTATIAIEDEQGQPVANAWVGGVGDMFPTTFKFAEPTCTIYALGADRPRRVCILQPERHLAASLNLTGDEPGPVTVRLAAPASITGRALDADGQPLANAAIDVSYMVRVASDLNRAVNQQTTPVKTDGEGRFHVADILPGERLALGFKQGDEYYALTGLTSEERQLDAGQKLDVGEVKLKRVR